MATVLGGVLSGAGNLMGGGGPAVPNVPLDPKAQGLMNGLVSNASDPNAIAGKMNEGVAGAGAQSLQSDQSSDQEAAQSGSNPGMLKAIRNQFNSSAQRGINSITNKNSIDAPVTQSDWLRQAGVQAQAEQNVMNHQYSMVTSAYENAVTARAQMWTSIMGVGSKGLGMAAAGRNKSGGGKKSGGPNGAAGDDGMPLTASEFGD